MSVKKYLMVYVVYWVDLDDDCLKKSEIEILGVFYKIKDAEECEEKWNSNHKGYCDDSRCHYTRISVEMVK
ncbi:MAG TPA: hypothetical protein VN703_07490 [Candidatus Sulfopaludibacter sp.]|nr:hypothetical protein [Candidatus Sulfopaludibacter sp.]